MARRTRRLGVWLDGSHIADFEQIRRPAIRCRYTAAALDRWPQNSPLISCSLPLQTRPHDALAFCQGLVPEGQTLQQMAAAAGLAVNDTFGLLARYGRDVAGALVIADAPPEVSRFGVVTYTDETFAQALDELDEYPLGAHDDSELSLAGLQDKLLLVDLGDRTWGRPLHGRPSTHILKVDDVRHPGLIRGEFHCLLLARELGLTTVDSELVRIGGADRLIVSRFDRVAEGQEIRRIHQEDLCQAAGIDADGERGRAKYQRAGGPGFRRAAELLDLYGSDPLVELDRLVRVVAFTCLIGNADAHGKNMALLHPTAETVTLAPLYDTVPTLLWPELRTDAAMTIGGRSSLTDVAIGDIAREAGGWGHSIARATTIASETIDRILEAIDREVIPPDSDVAELVRSRATKLRAGDRLA